MRVTVENWTEIERKILVVGIKDSVYNSNNELTTIFTNDGESYDVSKELFLQLQKKGMIELKIGKRVKSKDP
ncbi:MAG: hypothetical protein WCT99_07940 [Bacteroidota bacterium]